MSITTAPPASPAPQLATTIRVSHFDRVEDGADGSSIRTRLGWRNVIRYDAHIPVAGDPAKAVQLGPYTGHDSWVAAREGAAALGWPGMTGVVKDASRMLWAVPLSGDSEALAGWMQKQPHGWFQSPQVPGTQLTDVLLGASSLIVGAPYPMLP